MTIERPNLKTEIAPGYAANLHDKWRNSRKKAEGTAVDGQPNREERWKPIDPENHDSPKADIANTPFDKLPPAWQKENLLSAECAMEDIDDLTQKTPEIVDLEETSARTHVKWKERNPWAEGEQSGLYSELSTEEKNKDREVIQGAVDSIKEQGHNIRTINKGWSYEENLKQELKKTKQELKQSEGDKKKTLEERIGKLSHKLDIHKIGVHMDSPYGVYDKKNEGTEGAKPPLPVSNKGGEDRYGFLDEETIEDKQKRKGEL